MATKNTVISCFIESAKCTENKFRRLCDKSEVLRVRVANLKKEIVALQNKFDSIMEAIGRK